MDIPEIIYYPVVTTMEINKPGSKKAPAGKESRQSPSGVFLIPLSVINPPESVQIIVPISLYFKTIYGIILLWRYK